MHGIPALFVRYRNAHWPQRMGERSLKTWRRDRAKYWLQMCPDSNAAALRDMEAIFADSAGVRPATHSGTRYWLGLALVRDGQEERGLAMMEQAHQPVPDP